MTFRRLARANAPTYTVERSENLKTWDAVPQAPVFISSAGDVETVKVQVPITSTRMFLRVTATQPETRGSFVAQERGKTVSSD
jgi:hypothetical protein